MAKPKRGAEPPDDAADTPQEYPEGVFVRFEREILSRLHEIAGPSKSGRTGGVPHLIRKLVYDFLGLPLPVSFSRDTAPDPAKRARDLSVGGLTLKQVGEELEKEGYRTARGGTKWDPTQVRRLLNG